MQVQSSAGASVLSAAIKELERLLRALESNLETLKLSIKEQQKALEQVKTFGRDSQIARPIFSQQGISVLSKYALDLHDSNDVSREAMRCLANAFLLHAPSRQVFVDLGYPSKAADRYKADNCEDEFLLARILFLMTYNTTLDFQPLIDSHRLADSINQHILIHASGSSQAGEARLATAGGHEAALGETCKLLFNVTHFYPDAVTKFSSAVESLVIILLRYPLPDSPLTPPTSLVLNALLNLDLQGVLENGKPDDRSASGAVLSTDHVILFVDRMIEILDIAMRKRPEKDLDEAAAPLCTLLRRVYEIANANVQSHMRQRLLPSIQDRDKPLGQGDTFTARLLRLSTSPSAPTLSGNISALLFELSDRDANKFVQNIGYGFASGFLASQNISAPASATSTTSEPNSRDFNPITGQRWSAEDREGPSTAPMTEEEKEREAERLFVLFERLKATGVVDVKNPVERRFEEVDD